MTLISLTDYRPMPRYDGVSWAAARIEGAVQGSEGPWAAMETVPFTEPDPDPAKPVERNFTIKLEDPDVAWLRVVFLDAEGEQDLTNPVPVAGTTTELATIRDVALRLGRYLSDSEEVQVSSLIVSATNNIYAAVDKPSTWEPPPDVRDFLNGLCIELVARAMPNPHALASQSQSLGQYSVTQQFSRDIPGGGLMPTQAEELAARRIVYGRTSVSSRTRSLANDVSDSIYGTDPAEPDSTTSILAGEDSGGLYINTDVESDDAGEDGSGVWIASDSDSPLVGVDSTGPWIEGE